MAAKTDPNAVKLPVVRRVVKRLLPLLEPEAIYMYNRKVSAQGVTDSFKLCVIADVLDKQAAELAVYRQIDCEVPFDLLLYTPEEWREFIAQEDSFAHRIYMTGTILYGETL